MVIDINNTNPARPDGSARKGAASGADNTLAGVSAPSTADNTSVTLSSTARTLKALETQVNNLPEVNSERVNEVREKLNNGNYTINPENLAQKMLDIE